MQGQRIPRRLPLRSPHSASPIQSPQHYTLGRAVRRFRTRAELSQEAFGSRSGLHRNYVGAIERGEINPTFRILLKLAAGLNIQLSLLISEYEAMHGKGGQR